MNKLPGFGLACLVLSLELFGAALFVVRSPPSTAEMDADVEWSGAL